MRVKAFLVAAVVLAGTAAMAKPPAQARPPVNLAGVYIFDSVPAAVSPCVMKLDDNVDPNAPDFHNAWLSGGCEGSFSFLAALSGWQEIPGGGIRLVGAEGSTMGDFKLKAPGTYTAIVENDRHRYTLRRSQN